MLELNPPIQHLLKSHRKVINIPPESEKLAELLGIIYGDGGINNAWQLVITVNSVLDFQYASYIQGLLEDLFQIEVAVRKRPGMNALVLVCSSRSLLDFLVVRGAVRGNKVTQRIDIPYWIKKNALYERAVVRGLVDTDGCLYIHNHVTKGSCRTQHNIGFCFTNHSNDLIEFTAGVLNENGIVPHVSKNRTNVYLYSAKSVKKYLDMFGSSNPRITNKYEEWLKTRRGS